MYERQNSVGNLNFILHMNMDDNSQVVPNNVSDTYKTRNGVYAQPTSFGADDNSTIDINQIPLTVNNEFFMQSSQEKESENIETGVNSEFVNLNINHTQWSAASNINRPTNGHTDTQNAASANLSFDAGNDYELQEATNQVLRTGQMTPLLKQELKCSIQNKRLLAGKEELTVSFEEPKPDVLTPEEEQRVVLRRRQNREAAQRFRERQKSKTDHLQKECRKLEQENSSLRSELVKLRRENDELSTKFQQHMRICPLQPGFYSNVT